LPEELEDEEELVTIFIMLCFTDVSIALVTVGDDIAFITSVSKVFWKVGLDITIITDFSNVDWPVELIINF
jgi:hypothetical protein